MTRTVFAAATLAAALLTGAAAPAPNNVTGIIGSVIGTDMMIQDRFGNPVHIDAAPAAAAGQAQLLDPGQPVVAYGTRGADGVLHATSLVRAKPSAALWPADH